MASRASVFDIYFQTLAATSMLMSIGIAVEFIAHPVAAYEFATGTRNERLAAAMASTALPVAEGALSSFLGFCFLAASDFDFVYKYFFAIFLMICVFGTINALIFLPAILGLFGASKEGDDFRAPSVEASDRSITEDGSLPDLGGRQASETDDGSHGKKAKATAKEKQEAPPNVTKV